MMRTSCSPVRKSINIYRRQRIVEMTTLKAIPQAKDMKTLTGSRINIRFRGILEAQTPFAGFPNVSNSDDCSLCQIQNCFRDDCLSLKSFMEFINREMSSEFVDLIRNLNNGVQQIREMMDCDETSTTLVPFTEGKTKDDMFRVAKDAANYLKMLKQRYNEIN